MRRYRLTESRLRGMIREAVKNALRETYDFASDKRQFDINSPQYKEMYIDPEDLRYDKEEAERTAKEIADYEALPEKARHPYGGDFPDFSNRIKNRQWKNPHYGDKLAAKRPNSVADMGREKREYNQYLTSRYEEAVKNLPFIFDYVEEKYGDYRKLSKEQIVGAYEHYLDKYFGDNNDY